MKRVCVATVLGLSLALPAHADVTLKQTTGGKGMGISGTASRWLRSAVFRTRPTCKSR
jgi:hypothetical protein